MEFRILGPLEIRDRGQLLPVGTPRTRAVLGILLARPGSLVSVQQLIDELWPDEPPPQARALVRGYVSRLRGALRRGPTGVEASDRLMSRKPGYLIRVDDQELDLHRYERLVTEARTARQAGQLERCLTLFGQASQQWAGPAFADVPHTPAIAAAVTWLGELRLSIMEEHFDAALDAGHDADIVAGLTDLVTAHPLRERPVAQLMLALYRAGRTADALSAYQRAKQRLADELGVDPGADLKHLELTILRGDERPVTSAGAGPRLTDPRPAQLPAGLPSFTSRGDELAGLDAILARTTDQPTAVVISVSGTAGVGKTALAMHWAHRVADRFPDGQLYVDLRGFDPTGSAMSPDEAIRGFLDALGVTAPCIPAGLDARAGRYRSLLAGRRMLVVLDNARDTDQICPLLPGAPGCLVLVTSRNQLTSLVAKEGAHPVTLDLLAPDEALQLLTRRLGPARVAAELDAAKDIIASCARLPLALSIVAARAANHPTFRLADLAADLRSRRNGLDAFDGGEPVTDARAAFSWSYRALSDPAARLFRLLGLHSGPDIGSLAAASMAGIPVAQARSLLAQLARAHLVTERTPGRYTFHDLLRTYAAELARAVDGDAERRAARQRMFDHYLHTPHAAGRLHDPTREPALPDGTQSAAGHEPPTGHGQAAAEPRGVGIHVSSTFLPRGAANVIRDRHHRNRQHGRG